MFRFNANTHTATKICITSADYYTATSDRRFGTHSGMLACPEYQAYEACKRAYHEGRPYLPEDISEKLKEEMFAWQKAALSQQKPVYKIQWELDDWSNAQAWNLILADHCFTIDIDLYNEKIHFYEDDYEFATFAYYAFQVDLGHFYVTNGVTKLWFKFAE